MSERKFAVAPPGPGLELFDNHTHLDCILETDQAQQLGWQVRDVLDLARQAGVSKLVQVGWNLPSAHWTSQVITEFPELLGAIAIHPNEAPKHERITSVAPDGLVIDLDSHHETSLDEALVQIGDLAKANSRIRAFGETGLDYFRTSEAGVAAQKKSFRAHIALAKELGLAMQIHDRDAHADVVEILLADGAPQGTVFHCFAGDAELAEICNAQGWFMSFSGTFTFKANESLRQALRVADPSLILIETDAPFLTPHPHRGRLNHPAMIAQTFELMAEICGVKQDILADNLSKNTLGVYGSWD